MVDCGISDDGEAKEDNHTDDEGGGGCLEMENGVMVMRK